MHPLALLEQRHGLEPRLLPPPLLGLQAHSYVSGAAEISGQGHGLWHWHCQASMAARCRRFVQRRGGLGRCLWVRVRVPHAGTNCTTDKLGPAHCHQRHDLVAFVVLLAFAQQMLSYNTAKATNNHFANFDRRVTKRSQASKHFANFDHIARHAAASTVRLAIRAGRLGWRAHASCCKLGLAGRPRYCSVSRWSA